MMIWSKALLGMGRRRLAGGSARRGMMVVAAAGVALVCAGLVAPAGSARAVGAARPSGISWGQAERLRGSPVISYVPAISGIGGLSCWSVNKCATGGYTASSDFVAVERDGRWGRAAPLPGMAALGADGHVSAVSCAAGAYCVAGGFYGDHYAHWQAFVATLRNGRWQAPLQVPGSKVPRHQAYADSVSCRSARQCVVAGFNDFGTFVARQVKGTWRPAQSLNIGGGPNVMSCWSPLDCVVAKALVVTELNGVWGTPQAIPGPTSGQIGAVSCAGDGYCAVAGSESDGTPFVASGPDGTFGTAVTWPGFAPGLLSCPSAGNCAAAGGSQVVSQAGGVWGTPEQLPGTRTDVTILSLSCWSAGNCGAGGSYVAGGRTEPFVASETNGVWGAPEPVPGITALNKHNSRYNGVYAVSCPAARHCTATGTYSDAGGRRFVFVTGPA
jgi:hypothetical protein